MEKGKKYYYDNDKVHQIVVLGTLKDIQPTKRNGRNVYHFENDGILRNFEVEISDEELKNIHEMTTDLNDIEPIKKCMLELNQISTKEIEQNNKETPSVPEKRGMFASVTSMFTRTPEQKIAKIEEKQEKKKEEIKVLDKKITQIKNEAAEKQKKIKNEKSILSMAYDALQLLRIKSEQLNESVKLNLILDAEREKTKKGLALRLAEKKKKAEEKTKDESAIGGDNNNESLQEESIQQIEKKIRELEKKIRELEEENELSKKDVSELEEEKKKSKEEIEALEKQKQKVETTPGGKRRMKHKLTKKKRYAYPSKISERSSNIFNQNKKTRRFCVKNKQQIPANYVLRN